MSLKKIVLTDEVKHLVIHQIPDGLVSPKGHRFLNLLQDLVDQVNEANGFAPATTTVAPTTTAAPTTTV